jgi:hypothetical protein
MAAGAILAFAVDYQAQGVDIQSVGIILFIVGVIGLAFSMLFLASFAPFGSHDRYVERDYVERSPLDNRHTHDHI